MIVPAVIVRILCLALAANAPKSLSKVHGTVSSSDKQAIESPSTLEGTIRVLSWNILAPCYVKSPPPSWVDERSMEDWLVYSDWEYRESHIVDLLKRCEADIVCLQEVQISESVASCLESKLDEIGYDTYIQDSKGHPVANVILVAKKFDWKVVFQESRSRAFMMILESSDETKPPLFVVNVHLQATRRSYSENAQTRFSQVQSLVKRLNLAWGRIRDKLCPDESCDWASTQEPNVVVMGDFNLSPAEPLYTLLSEGKWPEDCKTHLPSKVSEVSASSLPLLPLRDIRGARSLTRGIGERWTYAATKQIFDYIFVSGAIEPVEHQDYVPEVLLDEGAQSPESVLEEGNKPRILWPNEHHPSDHIPIGATLQIKQCSSP